MKQTIEAPKQALFRLDHCFSVEHRQRVIFTRDAFATDNPILAELLTADDRGGPGRLLVTMDEGVAAAYPALPARIEAYFRRSPTFCDLVSAPVVLPRGEAAKLGWTQVHHVHRLIQQHRICRHSHVLAIGGGAHLDVVGFAAATAHRGVRHIRMPSTVLAQADSGVGVKNGVNAFGQKNFVGTFAPPAAVVNDFQLLQALPAKEQRAGFAEAVKVALIRSRDFFEELEREAGDLAAFESEAVERLILRCARLHLEHIATAGDPFELGSARPLDFGHWAAHKLELLSDHRLGHGEAVAIGVALDTLYSVRARMLPAAAGERVLRLLGRLGFLLWAPELGMAEADGTFSVLNGLNEFREHLGGRLTVTLLADLGRGIEVHEMDPALIREAIGDLARRAGSTHQGS